MKKLLMAALLSLPLVAVATVAGAQAPPESDSVGERVGGIVTGESGSVLELRTRHGEVDVHWTPDTDCAIGGEPATCETIGVGHGVLAIGSFAGQSGQFHADTIRARELPALDKVAGVVQSADGDTLTVETRDGATVSVVWGEDTRCRNREGRIDCERIVPRMRIVAAGELDGETLRAKRIGVAVARDLVRVRGTVEANHGSVVAVDTAGGIVNVHWDDETVCQTRSGQIDCASIDAGNRVIAAGTELGDHNLQAKRIFVHVPVPRPPSTDVTLRDVRPDRNLTPAALN